jgi:hypothetical protein
MMKMLTGKDMSSHLVKILRRTLIDFPCNSARS